jgi:hypothetical protein
MFDRSILDLGKDAERMTSQDAHRQHATVDRILEAFCGPRGDRREVQLLADEVGLGKTFVALVVAYAMLATLRERNPQASSNDFADCYRAVVVVTPEGNHPLTTKWADEVGALVKRCGIKSEPLQWFKSLKCETPEDLLIALRKASDLRRKPGSVPTLLVCQAGMFKRKLRESGPKLRFLSASLFRWLGPTLPNDVRWQVIRRAAEVRGFEDWTDRVKRGEAAGLWDFSAHERYLSLPVDDPERLQNEERKAFEAVPFRYEEMVRAFEKLKASEEGQSALFSPTLVSGCDEEPEGIVPYCKWIARKIGKPEQYFDRFKVRVSSLYRSLFPQLMGSNLPLVIADEAHHWRRETAGCRAFLTNLAPFSKRLLLLTATPFQLCREELEGILSRADSMEPAIGCERVAALREKRSFMLSAMAKSEEAGRAFSKHWGHLADDLRKGLEQESGQNHKAKDVTEYTRLVESYWQDLLKPHGTEQDRLMGLPPRLRHFFAAALELRKANSHLSKVMRELVIRHRRDSSHRRYRVGCEYPPKPGETLRPDQSQLHAARGSELPCDAELAQFLLMKVVASATRGRRKTALGMDVTGAYSTLWNSREGKKALAAAAQNEAKAYFSILAKLTGGQQVPNRADNQHPKVRLAVQEVRDCWERGEKTLIFCFRIPTANVLKELLSDEIERTMASARKALLRGHGASSDKEAMAQFKSSLTSRTGSVLPAFMDRVVLGLAQLKQWPFLGLDASDLTQIAQLAAQAYVDGRPAIRDVQKPDRVLLGRICEHVLAIKYLHSLPTIDAEGKAILDFIADSSWISTRYGTGRRIRSDSDLEETTDALTRSSLSATFELGDERDETVYQALLKTFQRSESRDAAGLLQSLVSGPNMYVPLPPFKIDDPAMQRARRMTEQIWRMTIQPDGMKWEERGQVVDAVNRALLRDHFLLRLPRQVFAGQDEQWSESLVRGFHSSQLFNGQSEPVAQKISDFLQELAQMTPSERVHGLRYALNPQGKAVVLVSGSTSERDAVFRGFNSPLLPEILICTQVGQEGIDLHRHCRHVIHYDLGWNPATIEQRTGRIDRIGSKTQRERSLGLDHFRNEGLLPGLEVALPYLAATYDERMFDRLFSRSQAFDLLTGGDPSVDPDDENGYEIEGVDEPGKVLQFVALPETMRRELRVDLRAL